MELKFVNFSYFKQLFQNLRPKLQYSKNRIFVTSHFGTLFRIIAIHSKLTVLKPNIKFRNQLLLPILPHHFYSKFLRILHSIAETGKDHNIEKGETLNKGKLMPGISL